MNDSKRLHETFGLADNENINHEHFVNNIHPNDLEIRRSTFERCFNDGVLEHISRVILPENQVRRIEVKGTVW